MRENHMEKEEKLLQEKLAKNIQEMEQSSINDSKEQERKLPIWVGLLIAIVFVAVSIGIILCGRSIGKTALTKMGFVKEKQVDTTMNDMEQTVSVTPIIEPTITPKVTIEATPTPEPTKELDQVYHVLLLGIESLEGVDCSDTVMVASMNTTDGTVGMIQFMGDLYVEIPGYGENQLSKAYQLGGGVLLAETITTNFELVIEGYLSVDFANFTKIIDHMGGVTLDLTKEEADYLNKTNYISQKANRTMKEGSQIANGDQALGYCRIKDIPTASDSKSDMGRMERASVVMKELVKKVSKMNYGELLSTMNETLPYIRTNLTKEKFRNLLEMLSQLDLHTIDFMRIPLWKLYEKETINDMVAYIPKLEETCEKLNTFLYGEEDE